MSLTFLLPLLCSTNIQCGYFYKRHYKNIHGSADIFAELTEHELETGELLLDFPKPATSVVAIPDGYVRMQGWTLTEKNPLPVWLPFVRKQVGGDRQDYPNQVSLLSLSASSCGLIR